MQKFCFTAYLFLKKSLYNYTTIFNYSYLSIKPAIQITADNIIAIRISNLKNKQNLRDNIQHTQHSLLRIRVHWFSRAQLADRTVTTVYFPPQLSSQKFQVTITPNKKT